KAQNVGHDVLAREGEGAAGSKPGLDLVAYKKDAAGVASFADTPQVTVGGHADAALSLDGLDDHGRDRVVQDLVQRLEVIERDVADAFQHRREGIAILRVGGGGEGAKGASVIGAVRGDDADASGGDTREFEPRLDRFGARVPEGDPAQGWRAQGPP